jgi:hypothetical protein
MTAQRAPGSGTRLRRWVTLVGGYSLLVVGGMLLVLPGPGLPLIIAGLAILEREEAWARRLRVRLQRRFQRFRRRRRADRAARPEGAEVQPPTPTPPPLEVRNAAD